MLSKPEYGSGIGSKGANGSLALKASCWAEENTEEGVDVDVDVDVDANGDVDNNITSLAVVDEEEDDALGEVAPDFQVAA